jgi:hypothetical protein
MARRRSELTFYAEPKSFEDLGRAMEAVLKETDRSVTEALEFGGTSFARSGGANTKTARKNAKRQIVELNIAPDGSRANNKDRRRAKFGAVVLRQDKRPKYLPIWTKARDRQAGMREARRSKKADVPRIGAAKNSWNGMKRMLNMKQRSAGYKKTGAVSSVKKKYRGEVKSLTLLNKLKYLLKIHPKIEDTAGRKAAKSMFMYLERRMDRLVKKYGF